MRINTYKAIKISFVTYALIIFSFPFFYDLIAKGIYDISPYELMGVILIVPIIIFKRELCLSLILIFSVFMLLMPLSHSIFPELGGYAFSHTGEIILSIIGMIISIATLAQLVLLAVNSKKIEPGGNE